MFESIIDPTLGPAAAAGRGPVGLAERPAELPGLRLGLLANGKRNAQEFLDEVAALLVEQYGVTTVLSRRKLSIVEPAPAEMLAELRSECDIVVIGVGDCGSCSASAVADGLLLEESGLPAAVICSDAFEVSADAMASVRGTPGYRYVTTAHPVANLGRDAIKARAVEALPKIVGLLRQAATA
jgi:hypothetical protein